MKRLYRYLLKSFLGPLLLTFLIVLFIMIMQFLWKYIDDLVGKGLDFSTLGELLFYFTLSFVPMTLPLAILLASLMTFGNMGENFELTAIKSSGVSLQRFMKPLVVFVVIISLSAFYFSNNVLPITNLKSRSLLFDIQRQRPEFSITEGQFYNGIEGYSIKISEKDYKTNLLKRIFIYDHTEKLGNISLTYADSGYMNMTPDEQNLIFTLFNGYSYNEVQSRSRKRRRTIGNSSYPGRKDTFEKETIVLRLTGFGLSRTDEDLFKNNYSMLNLTQLEQATDSLTQLLERRKSLFKKTLVNSQLFTGSVRIKRLQADTLYNFEPMDSVPFNPRNVLASLSQSQQIQIIQSVLMRARSSKNFVTTSKNTVLSRKKNIRRHQIEWHRKFTLSFACLIFFFVGAPLGAIIRKGGLGMPVVISVLFFLLYHITSMSGEKFVKQDVLSAASGMWMSSMVLLPIGIFLTYKSTNDSQIMDINTYLDWPKKMIRKLSGNSDNKTVKSL